MTEITPLLPDLFGADSAMYDLSARYLDYQMQKNDRKEPAIIHFNSRDRDRDMYPYASSFRVQLPTTLHNVERLSLPALEFTNTSMSVHEKNNVIKWIDGDENIETQAYSAKINVGVYTLTTLVTELLRAMNAVPRRNTNILHHFNVSTMDNPQNGMTFYNIVSSQDGVENDPLSTIANSQVIVVRQTAHGLKVGDTIWLYGVSGAPGGIPDDVLNGSPFSISTIVDENSFTIISQVVPYITGDGGGTDVMIGRATNFQFVQATEYDEKTRYSGKSLLQLLGFPPVSCLLLYNAFTIPDFRDALATVLYSYPLLLKTQIWISIIL